ncbi:MAG: SBBP repeat-containing protein, partial [Anaerolineae bacterium]|nr:SBBP repeat-containing protein [Anaerolineae bacterium]
MLKFTAGGQALAFGTSQVYLAGLDHALKVEFNGGNLVTPVADQNAGVESSSLPPLGRVIYPEVWPGVTVEYTSAGNGMKSAFLVSAGGNPADISLKYSAPLEIQPDGSLSITMENGRMTESAPVAWQEVDGRRVPVKVEFALQGECEVGFILGAYDPALPLVIDPEYLWNGFWGTESAAADIVLDASGNILLVGRAYSSWNGSDLRHAFNGTNNVVVVKLNSEGVYQWHAFYGGGDSIDPRSVTLDSDGNMYIGGMTDNG